MTTTSLKKRVVPIITLALLLASMPAVTFADTTGTSDSDTASSTPIVTSYKASFKAHLNGETAASSTNSIMTGDGIFNISMDERQIDYSVDLENGSGVMDITLVCGSQTSNDHIVVTLFHSAGASTIEGMAAGSIVLENLTGDAVNCQPNIHDVPQLTQAMREGKIYLNVSSTSYAAGEIRGQLMSSEVTTLPAYPGNTVTPPTEPAGGSGEATTTPPVVTAPPTPETTSSSSNSGGSRIYGSGRHDIGTTSSTGGEVLGASTGPDCKPYLTSYIRTGMMNDSNSVVLLQRFLNDNQGAGLSVTGLYDLSTETSVRAFQLKYKEEILRPWVAFGLPSDTTSTGYVYKTTLRKINNLSCEGLNLPEPILP